MWRKDGRQSAVAPCVPRVPYVLHQRGISPRWRRLRLGRALEASSACVLPVSVMNLAGQGCRGEAIFPLRIWGVGLFGRVEKLDESHEFIQGDAPVGGVEVAIVVCT